jgi:hypothetical protein
MDSRTEDQPAALHIGHRETLNCRNCGASAPEVFCPQCGQDTAEHLPTFREFVHEFVLHYLAAEGKLWRTLLVLVSRPGFLTTEYLSGRKLRYVQPLRLYLTCSVVFFLALKLSLAIVTHDASGHELAEMVRSDHFDFEIGLSPWTAERHLDDSFTCHLPAAVCDRVRSKLYGPRDELQKMLVRLPEDVFSHMSTAMFLLLPIFALLLTLVYRKRTYGEHFLFALHLHSLAFLVLLLALLPLPSWLEAVLLIYLVVFSFLSLRRVYSGSVWITLSKSLLIAAVYLSCLAVVTAALGIAAVVE